MTTILGIDAAWTATEPSGVALVTSDRHGWRCIAAAPSYCDFLSLACGILVPWTGGTPSGGPPNVPQLLATARTLAGADVDLVVVDMPVATVPIVGRRVADDAVSMAFGGCGCSTHSPNRFRPGALGARLTQDLANAGYPLATSATTVAVTPATVEAYPHPALLSLLGQSSRIPYKIGRSNRYWPGVQISQRVRNLLHEFGRIDAALIQCLGPTGVPLPPASSVTRLSHLKRFEDALDALICAWVGTCYVAGAVTPYGDPTAAIWIP
jgi:predicted RNase H-like nuclease